MTKINMGSGAVLLRGWTNIDTCPEADVRIDIRRGLPFPSGSVSLVFSEHFIEHLTYEEGGALFREVKRVLVPGGVVRTATVDLDYVVMKYMSDWRDQVWLSHPDYRFVRTRGMMLNMVEHSWGHKFVYNEEDLSNQLRDAGFTRIVRYEAGKSDEAELLGIERRPDSKLVMEASG